MDDKHIARTTRRTVLAGIAAALTPEPLFAQAQQPDGMRRVGFLASGLANDALTKAITPPF